MAFDHPFTMIGPYHWATFSPEAWAQNPQATNSHDEHKQTLTPMLLSPFAFSPLCLKASSGRQFDQWCVIVQLNGKSDIDCEIGDGIRRSPVLLLATNGAKGALSRKRRRET